MENPIHGALGFEFYHVEDKVIASLPNLNGLKETKRNSNKEYKLGDYRKCGILELLLEMSHTQLVCKVCHLNKTVYPSPMKKKHA